MKKSQGLEPQAREIGVDFFLRSSDGETLSFMPSPSIGSKVAGTIPNRRGSGSAEGVNLLPFEGLAFHEGVEDFRGFSPPKGIAEENRRIGIQRN